MDRRKFLKQSGSIAAASLAPGLLLKCGNLNTSKRPNILWIYVEDMTPLLSCYGVDINQTPVFDKLAQDGVKFEKTFMPAPVCSATRSALITGTMQTTFGLHNHRSSRDDTAPISLPEGVKTLPELFREAGYYTYNSGKDDYNFEYDRKKLYEGKYFYNPKRKEFGVVRADGHWKNRKPGQPFFGQIELKGGKNQNEFNNPIDRKRVDLPPYYPDHPLMREEWARHHDQVKLTDIEVGKIIEELKNDGILDETVIFFFSDHGMRSLRHKQFLYDGGIHVPLIVTWYGNKEKIKAGISRKDLVSGIDISATSLALGGIDIPQYMEGRNLFASDFKERDYIISARDRCDFTIDRIRCVRTNKYKYIRNFMTDRSYTQPNYRDKRETTLLLKQLYKEGKLNKVQERFMSEDRSSEELYDLETDPHETVNLVKTKKYNEVLIKHRKILNDWIMETDDKGQYPENMESLRAVYKRLGERCVNPEFDKFKILEKTGGV